MAARPAGTERGAVKRLLRALATVVVLLLVLVAASPGLIYLAALSRIDGRPEPGAAPGLSVEQQNWLRCELAAGDNLHPSVTNPWQLAWHFLREDTLPGYGDRLAWLVARDYLHAHLDHPRAAEWTLSGMALTIWVARHWSAPQMEVTAHEQLRQAHSFRCAPGAAEWPQAAPGK